MRIPLILTLVLLVPAFPADASGPAALLYAEDFDGAMYGWTLGAGMTKDCEVAMEGCSLKAFAPCCRAYSQAYRNLTFEPPAEGNLTFSIGFRGASNYGNHDSSVDYRFTNGWSVSLATTEGYNNGLTMTIHNETGAARTAHVSWAQWQAGRWYALELDYDPSGSVQARAFLSGNLVANSTTLPFPANARPMQVSVGSVQWSSHGSPMNYDALCIGQKPLPASCEVHDDTLTISFQVAPHEARYDDGLTFHLGAYPGEGRAIASWELLTGNGGTHGGTGAPPATLHLTFLPEDVGEHTARFTVVQDDGQTLTAQRFYRILGDPPELVSVSRDIENPVSRTLEEPERVDTVTVTAIVSEPQQQATTALLCWEADGIWAASTCHWMDGAGTGTQTAQIAYRCAGPTITYHVRLYDSEGHVTISEPQSFSYEGIRLPGDAQCATESRRETRNVL